MLEAITAKLSKSLTAIKRKRKKYGIQGNTHARFVSNLNTLHGKNERHVIEELRISSKAYLRTASSLHRQFEPEKIKFQ